MSTTNYPSATPSNQPPKKDYRGLIIGLLAVGLLGTWGYLLWNNNKQDQLNQTNQQQIAKVTNGKNPTNPGKRKAEYRPANYLKCETGIGKESRCCFYPERFQHCHYTG